MIYIIWPEERYVSDKQIASWYDDQVADGNLLYHPCDARTPLDMAHALEDIGLLTLGRAP